MSFFGDVLKAGSGLFGAVGGGSVMGALGGLANLIPGGGIVTGAVSSLSGLFGGKPSTNVGKLSDLVETTGNFMGDLARGATFLFDVLKDAPELVAAGTPDYDLSEFMNRKWRPGDDIRSLLGGGPLPSAAPAGNAVGSLARLGYSSFEDFLARFRGVVVW